MLSDDLVRSGDESRRVAQRARLAAAGQRDQIEEGAVPISLLNHATGRRATGGLDTRRYGWVRFARSSNSANSSVN